MLKMVRISKGWDSNKTQVTNNQEEVLVACPRGGGFEQVVKATLPWQWCM